MGRIGEVLDAAVLRLSPVAGDAVRSECLLLMAFATGRQTTSLRLSLDDEIPTDQVLVFEAAIAKREQHQPISQIVGYRDFWKHRFQVTPDVLDPRPDTETLIEKAVELGPFETVLDLGTGSGCILLSLLDEWPLATGVGIDASAPALNVARINAQAMSLTEKCEFTIGDWCNKISRKFDLVVSNPPYITQDAMDTLAPDVRDWEPRIALTPEGDGLDAYRQIANTVQNVMNPNGLLLLEIGFDQGADVSQLLLDQGMQNLKLFQDINGKDRVVHARKPSKIPI